MAKWKSPLFSDIRNALGDSVVFSMWKGRSYFRTYVVPSNPKTLKQEANRGVLAKIVERWQAVIDNDDKKGVWNALGLPFLISGFNTMCKYGMKSAISCPATGTNGTPFVVTYTLGYPAAKAKLYHKKDDTYTDITPVEGLTAGDDQTVNITISVDGDYELFLAHADALVDPDTHPQDYAAITKWAPDIVNGVAKAAEITITT